MTIDPTTWIKATASAGNGNCVEMRRHNDKVQVRDTKAQGTGPALAFAPAEFAAWLEGAKNGEFDRL